MTAARRAAATDGGRLLETIETLAKRRIGEAEHAVLALVPAGPDAERSPAARRVIERGRHPDQQARVAVADTRDETAESDRDVEAAQPDEDGPALEDRAVDGPDHGPSGTEGRARK